VLHTNGLPPTRADGGGFAMCLRADSYPSPQREAADRSFFSDR